MPRNPDKAKELIERLSREIAKYGDEGKSELRALFVGDQRPDVILALPPGPDRSARAAQLVGSLQEIAREMAESRASQIGSSQSKKKPKKRERKKRESPSDIIAKGGGQIDGFSYTIGRRRDGQFAAKITRRGRQIIEDDKAPKIYENDRLRRLFDSRDEAEFAVQRVINTALVWYSQRGLTPREKVRRSRKGRSGVRRRTASDRAALYQEQDATRRIAARKQAAAERAERIRQEKIQERRLGFIPRNNPSSPFSFLKSDTSASRQAEKSLQSYAKAQDKWKESLAAGRPRFSYVMKAYDALENARANLLLSGQKEKSEKVDARKASLRQELVDIFSTCSRSLSAGYEPERNPQPETHKKKADEFCEKAKNAMSLHKEKGSFAKLLDAYKYFECAKLEYRSAKNKTGLKKATTGAKKAREALKKFRG